MTIRQYANLYRAASWDTKRKAVRRLMLQARTAPIVSRSLLLALLETERTS